MDSSDSESLDPLIPSPNGEKPKVVLPLECCFSPTQWWLVPLGTLESAFMFSVPFLPGEPEQELWKVAFLCWPMGLVMASGVIWITFELLRCQIRADVNGLIWRRAFTGWKSVKWEEITDFYEAPTRFRGSRVVEAPAGILTLNSALLNGDQMANLIAVMATHTNNRGWGVKGMRQSEEWSKTFTPWTNEQKWSVPAFAMAWAFLIGLLTVNLWAYVQHAPRPLGFWANIFPLIIGSIIGLPIVLGHMWMQREMWRSRKFAWNHRDEKLTFTAQGLLFTSDEQRIEAKWNELLAISYLPEEGNIQPVEFKTTRGNFIVGSGRSFEMWGRVKPIVKQYAPELLISIGDYAYSPKAIESDLDGEKGAWSSGIVGVGARRWSFRSRETRFVLQCASGLIPLVPFFYLITAYFAVPPESDGPPDVSWPIFSGLLVLSGVAVALGWMWFRRAAIVAEDDGFEIRSLFHRPRRASWNQIQSVNKSAWGDYVRIGQRRIYFARLFQPVRKKELLVYIERHIGKGS